MTTNAPQGMNRTLISPLEIDREDVYQKLFEKERRKDAFTWMNKLGMSAKIEKSRLAKNLVYQVYEETFAFKMAHKASAVANGAGDDVAITIAAADHNNGRTNIIERQVVYFPNGAVGFAQSINRAGAQEIVTVIPMNASQDVQAAAAAANAAGHDIVFGNTGFPEASDSAEGRTPDVDHYDNQLMTSRSLFKVSDYEQIVEKEFEYKGQKFFFPIGVDQMSDRFIIDRELMCLIQRKSDGNCVDADGKKIIAGEGVIPAVTDAGGTFNYDPTANPAEPTLETWENLVKFITKIRGTYNYFGGVGQDLNIGFQNFLHSFVKDTHQEMNYNSFPGGKDQALNLNFKSLSYTQRNFHWMEWDILSDPDMLGGDGFDYSKSCLWIPAGSTRDPKSGSYVPYLQSVYGPHNVKGGSDRGEFAFFEQGMQASGGPTDSKAERRFEHYGHFGMEIRGRDKFIYQTPS